MSNQNEEMNFEDASSVQGKNLVWSKAMVKDADKQFFLGAVVIGEYLGVKQVNTVNGESNVYRIKHKESGEIYDFWGTTVLDSKFTEGWKGGAIPVGAIIRIEYLGLQKAANPKPGAKPFHNFKVGVHIPAENFAEAGEDKSGGY